MCTGELVNLSWTSHTMYSWTSHTMTTVGFSYWPLGSLFDTSLDKVSIATDHLPYLHCYLTLTYLVGSWSAGFSYSANLYSLSYTTVLAFVPDVTLISIGLALQQSMNLNPIGLVYYPGLKSSRFMLFYKTWSSDLPYAVTVCWLTLRIFPVTLLLCFVAQEKRMHMQLY